jgi:hypothetical protein
VTTSRGRKRSTRKRTCRELGGEDGSGRSRTVLVPTRSAPLTCACALRSNGTETDEYDDCNWQGNSGACAQTIACRTTGPLYVASVTFAVLLTIGAGASDNYPRVDALTETCLVLTLVLVNAVVWTKLLATFCDVATNGNPQLHEFYLLLGAMNRFLDRHSIPDSLRRRAREYLYQAANTSNAKEDEERLLDLSPTLRGDLILSSSVFAWLWKVTIFRGFEVELLVQIPQSMTAFLYAPYELPEQMRFYIMNKGVVMFGGKVYTSGRWLFPSSHHAISRSAMSRRTAFTTTSPPPHQPPRYGRSFWGQDMIVSNPTYQNTANTARCLTFAETYSIDADTLYEIAEEFPTATRLLKTR